MNRDPSAPIADEAPRRKVSYVPKEDKLKDYRDRRDEDDYVPEPPTY